MKISSADFDKEVLQSPMPVLVDFYADWCGPCKMMKPVLNELGIELMGQVKVVMVNVDESADIAKKYSIMGIPAFKLFKGGKVVAETAGGQSKEELRSFALKS